MMRLTWDTKYLGTWHMDVQDGEVMENLGHLAALGFTARVTMLDNDPQT